jgi:hypothetical protein
MQQEYKPWTVIFSWSPSCTQIINKHITYTFLDVLQQEGWGPQVIHGTVKEALDFLLVQIHCYDMGETWLAQHLGQQLAHNAATFPHFACIWQQTVQSKILAVSNQLSVTESSNSYRSHNIHSNGLYNPSTAVTSRRSATFCQTKLHTSSVQYFIKTNGK